MEAHRKAFPIKLMCQTLRVSERGFYKWRGRPKSKHQQRDEVLIEKIRVFHCNSRYSYGSPRIHSDLKKAGEKVSQKRVARLMRQQGIRGRSKRKFKTTSNSNPKRLVAGNHLQQKFQTDAPNQKWVSDITYILTKEGWLYLAVILDLYSRRVVGWAMAERMTDALTLQALSMAISRRTSQSKTGLQQLIFHSDKGSQYASNEFRCELRNYKIIQSMSGNGSCFDNAPAESFFATLKTEEVKPIGRAGYSTRQQAKTAIFDYIETFYNRTRRHSALGYLSPLDFEKQNQHNARQVA